MKAVQFARFGGPEVLEYVDIPQPVAQGDEVLIEVAAAGVNFPDIRERMGVAKGGLRSYRRPRG